MNLTQQGLRRIAGACLLAAACGAGTVSSQGLARRDISRLRRIRAHAGIARSPQASQRNTRRNPLHESSPPAGHPLSRRNDLGPCLPLDSELMTFCQPNPDSLARLSCEDQRTLASGFGLALSNLPSDVSRPEATQALCNAFLAQPESVGSRASEASAASRQRGKRRKGLRG